MNDDNGFWNSWQILLVGAMLIGLFVLAFFSKLGPQPAQPKVAQKPVHPIVIILVNCPIDQERARVNALLGSQGEDPLPGFQEVAKGVVKP